MKKRKLLLIPLLTLALLTGCGDSYHEAPAMESESVSVAPGSSDSFFVVSDSASKSTGGDYSSTTISGDFADYSYNFAANGNTTKTKQDMLDYYESVQKLVNENGGFIENVDNKYNGYVIDPADDYISDSEKEYTATGTLSFTVEIPNDKISVITDSLENFCKDNHFIVTTYSQKITNYQGYQIVDSYDQSSYNSNVITQKELDRTLKYASLRVNISYSTRRPFIARLGLGIKQLWLNFIDGIGEVIMVFMALAVGFIVLFVEAIIFYKIWKGMIFRHRKKKPQYYPAKHIYVDNENAFTENNTKECLCDKCI